jgi:hypothetical protein
MFRRMRFLRRLIVKRGRGRDIGVRVKGSLCPIKVKSRINDDLRKNRSQNSNLGEFLLGVRDSDRLHIFNMTRSGKAEVFFMLKPSLTTQLR